MSDWLALCSNLINASTASRNTKGVLAEPQTEATGVQADMDVDMLLPDSDDEATDEQCEPHFPCGPSIPSDSGVAGGMAGLPLQVPGSWRKKSGLVGANFFCCRSVFAVKSYIASRLALGKFRFFGLNYFCLTGAAHTKFRCYSKVATLPENPGYATV